MKFRQLEYFVQIVDSGSLAKAARELFVVQPALSAQLAKLEEEVGKKLLIRSSRGIAVTDHGAALYQHAKFVLRQMESAVKIARQDVLTSGIVSVGLTPTTVSALGAPLVTHLRAKYPGITLSIIESMSGHLMSMLRANELDLAIRFTNAPIDDMHVTPLLEEELFVLMPGNCDWLPADATSMTLAEAAKLPLLLQTGRHGLRPRISVEMERLGLEFNIVAEIDSLSLLLSCVAGGMGVTIQPMMAAMAPYHGAPLRCVKLAGARMNRKNFLYSLPDARLSYCATLVREELGVVVKKLVKSGHWTGVRLLDPGR